MQVKSIMDTAMAVAMQQASQVELAPRGRPVMHKSKRFKRTKLYQSNGDREVARRLRQMAKCV